MYAARMTTAPLHLLKEQLKPWTECSRIQKGRGAMKGPMKYNQVELGAITKRPLQVETELIELTTRIRDSKVLEKSFGCKDQEMTLFSMHFF